MAIPTLAMIPSGYKAGKLYSVLPSDGTGDFTVARNSVATRVNQSGLIEEVGVNVPRLDYSAGGCPVLLTEIESQNLITYSEDFSQWGNARTTDTANQAISPDGANNAGFFEQQSGQTDSGSIFLSSLSLSSGTYTQSIFAKKKDKNFIVCYSANAERTYFNLSNGTIGTVAAGNTAKIEDYGNGWFRCAITYTITTGSVIAFYLADTDNSTTVTDSGGVYIWGAQLEVQPTATSYIKSNSGSATTREADLVNGAGSAATFNSLEHTFFVDLNSLFQSGTTSSISIVGSTGTVSSNRIMILKQANNTDVTFQIKSGGATAATETLSNIDSSVRQKLVITVKLNEVKYYRNGFLFATDTGTIPLPVSLGEITLTSGTTGSPLAASTKDIRYYNQVLTEAETLELMSYDSFNEMASALQYTIK